MTYQPKIYRKHGADELVVASGGKLNLESGSTATLTGTVSVDGTLSVASGGKLSLESGSTATLSGAISVDGTLAVASGGKLSLESGSTATLSGAISVDGSLTIESGATLTIASGGLLIDTDGKYEDLRFPSASLRVPGSGGPGISAVVGNCATLAFDADTREVVHLQAQMPHSWKKGSTITPHVHYCTTASTGGNIRWALEYSIADLNSNFTAATTAHVTAAASTQHKLASFGDINMSSYTGPSTMILMRLSRNSTATEDSHTIDAHLLEFDLHYLVNSLGSSGAASAGP